MGIKIDDVTAFAAAIQHKSISRAASLLGLTQPAVTRRIQSLEETLGAALLDRDTRPPLPTEIGWKVYEQAKALLREADAMRALVRVDHDPHGSIRLGMPQTLAEYSLIHIMNTLRNGFPSLNAQVITRWGKDLSVLVENGELDGAILMSPADHQFAPGLVTRSLAPFEMVVIGARGALAPGPQTLGEIGLPWVLNPDGCGFRDILMRAVLDSDRPFQLAMDTFGIELQIKLVSEGVGIGLVPLPCLQKSAHRKGVEVLEMRDFHLSASLWLIQHQDTAADLAGPLSTFADGMLGSFM